MKIHHQLASAALWLALGASTLACAGKRAESTAPTTPTTPQARAPALSPTAPARPRADDTNAGADDDETELIVSREIVAHCPTLRAVREHIGAFDPDMAWLAVLESIADCMSEGGAMAQQAIAVSGDEEHRRVVRQVLGSHGVIPTRVIAKPISPGAAECQRGVNCSNRVEMSIVSP
jgi:hypothetical protein